MTRKQLDIGLGLLTVVIIALAVAFAGHGPDATISGIAALLYGIYWLFVRDRLFDRRGNRRS